METHEHQKGPDIQKELKTHLSGAAETFKDLKSSGKFNFGKEFMNAIEILKLNGKKMEEVAGNKSAALPALLFILIGALAFHIGIYFFFANMMRGLGGLVGMSGFSVAIPIFDLLISFVLLSVMTIVGIFIYDFVGSTFFKGHGKFGELFRVLGYANLVMIVSIFMQIGFIGGIWLLVVSYIALTKIKKLNTTNTVLTMIISLVAVAVLSYLVNLLFVNVLHWGGMFSMYNSEFYQMMNMRFY
ncbi:YIP1 family protein [Candidatus Peregrinibacteria bacterium]|nr:YIP1 family protein [Candidatus Peregrinibacteria bacterium]